VTASCSCRHLSSSRPVSLTYAQYSTLNIEEVLARVDCSVFPDPDPHWFGGLQIRICTGQCCASGIFIPRIPNLGSKNSNKIKNLNLFYILTGEENNWGQLTKRFLELFTQKKLSLRPQKYDLRSRIQGSKSHRIPDPDLHHWYWEWGYVSRSMEIDPLKNKPDFQPFELLYLHRCRTVPMFYDIGTYSIFFMSKFNFLWQQRLTRIRIRIGLAPWIRIHPQHYCLIDWFQHSKIPLPVSNVHTGTTENELP
jgi:hypothetical protein